MRLGATEFRPDAANIPTAVALVAIDQRALDNLQLLLNGRRVWEVATGVSSIGKTQGQLLRIERLHVEQRANLRSGRSTHVDELLREVTSVRERQVQAWFRGHFTPVGEFFGRCTHRGVRRFGGFEAYSAIASL
jgi:hypothetical protein